MYYRTKSKIYYNSGSPFFTLAETIQGTFLVILGISFNGFDFSIHSNVPVQIVCRPGPFYKNIIFKNIYQFNY